MISIQDYVKDGKYLGMKTVERRVLHMLRSYIIKSSIVLAEDRYTFLPTYSQAK